MVGLRFEGFGRSGPGPRLRELKTHRSGEAPEAEPELLLQGSAPTLMVSRLEETTPKFQEVDVDAYRR